MRKILMALLLMLPVAGFAHTVAVIGTGDVASALGPEFAAQGHDVTYGSRKPDSDAAQELVEATPGTAKVMLPAAAVRGADIVVLAVPASVVVSVAQSLGDLSGKILIDPTNAFRFTDNKLVEAVSDTPVALSLQEAVPDAHVVKAFHVLNYRVMIDPELAGGPMTIPMVGDSAEAKATVTALAEGMGFHTMDLGPVRYAKELEGLLVLWFNARLSGQPFNYYFRPEPRPAG
ncbi:MAG: NADPH-dependent F420 reductase [Lysobacterales bacterium]